MYVSKALSEATTIESIVNMVNEGVAEGMEGIEFNSEQLAGQYAYEAALEAGYGVDSANLEAHLDALEEAGARFDYYPAVDHGMKIYAASQNND